jgi:hypothetical protein
MRPVQRRTSRTLPPLSAGASASSICPTFHAEHGASAQVGSADGAHALMFVSTSPGAYAFTVMPCLPSSDAVRIVEHDSETRAVRATHPSPGSTRATRIWTCSTQPGNRSLRSRISFTCVCGGAFLSSRLCAPCLPASDEAPARGQWRAIRTNKRRAPTIRPPRPCAIICFAAYL